MGLFGKTTKDPKREVKQWISTLKKENSQLDRQIKRIQREEQKVKLSLQEAAKKGNNHVCKILAKEILHARRSIPRLQATKVHINSVIINLNHQLANYKITGSLEKNAEVMEKVQSLLKIPEMYKTMGEMSREMMKLGILDEIIEDSLEGLEDVNDIEEETQEEIDKILMELTGDAPGTKPESIDNLNRSNVRRSNKTEVTPSTSKIRDDMDDMKERLLSLRS